MYHWKLNSLIHFDKVRQVDNSVGALQVLIAATRGWSYAQNLWGKFRQDNGLRQLFLTPVFSQSAFEMLEAVFESMEDL